MSEQPKKWSVLEETLPLQVVPHVLALHPLYVKDCCQPTQAYRLHSQRSSPADPLLETLTQWDKATWPSFCRLHFQIYWLLWNLMYDKKNSLKCVFNFQVNNKPTLVQIMAWYQIGAKPLSEPTRWLQYTHAPTLLAQGKWWPCLSSLSIHELTHSIHCPYHSIPV